MFSVSNTVFLTKNRDLQSCWKHCVFCPLQAALKLFKSARHCLSYIFQICCFDVNCIAFCLVNH